MTEYNSRFASHYSHQHGHIMTNLSTRSGGKKFAKWTFKDKKNNRVDIDVYLMRNKENGKMYFSAHCPGIKGKFESADPNTLAELIEDAYRQDTILRDEIEWEEWLEVKVSGTDGGWHNSGRRRSISSGYGSHMDVEINKLLRGVDKEGNVWTIHNNEVIIPFPEPKKIGEESSDFMVSKHEEISYIPATSENILALEKLVTKMSMLRMQLAEFLSQDNINAAICDMSKQFLLEG